MAALALPLLTTGISALAGLFGAKPKSTVTDTSGSSHSDSNSTSTPNIGANQQSLENQFTQGITKQLNDANDMSGYTGQGLQQINQTSGVADKMAQNILAARGLSNSPYAATMATMNNNNRLNQQSQFLNQIPLLQTQLRQNAIQQAIQGSQAIPFGSTTQGSSDSSGTSHSVQSGGSGSPVAGALSGFGAALNAPMGGGVSAGQQIAAQLGNIFGSKSQATGASYYDPSAA